MISSAFLIEPELTDPHLICGEAGVVMSAFTCQMKLYDQVRLRKLRTHGRRVDKTHTHNSTYIHTCIHTPR